jgi:hypothetical protein
VLGCKRKQHGIALFFQSGSVLLFFFGGEKNMVLRRKNDGSWASNGRNEWEKRAGCRMRQQK